MEKKKLKRLSIGLWIFLFTLNLIGFVLAANSVEVGSDPEMDLRKFDDEWLSDEIEDSVDSIDDLEDAYDVLYDTWDDETNAKRLSVEEYNENNFVDITRVKITDLEESTAKFVVSVKGNAEEAERPWVLYIWSNCSNDASDFWLMCIYIPSGIGGGDLDGVFYGECGDDNCSGDADFQGGGSDIELEFPSDWYDEDENCGVRVIMAAPDDEDDISSWYIDIFPGNATIDWWWWILLLILIILIIIAVIAIVYYLMKRRKREKAAGRIKSKKD